MASFPVRESFTMVRNSFFLLSHSVSARKASTWVPRSWSTISLMVDAVARHISGFSFEKAVLKSVRGSFPERRAARVSFLRLAMMRAGSSLSRKVSVVSSRNFLSESRLWGEMEVGTRSSEDAL